MHFLQVHDLAALFFFFPLLVVVILVILLRSSSFLVPNLSVRTVGDSDSALVQFPRCARDVGECGNRERSRLNSKDNRQYKTKVNIQK